MLPDYEDRAWRSARRLQRKCKDALRIHRRIPETSTVGVSRIAGEPLVGDLPERTFAEIGAWSAGQKALEEATVLAEHVRHMVEGDRVRLHLMR